MLPRLLKSLVAPNSAPTRQIGVLALLICLALCLPACSGDDEPVDRGPSLEEMLAKKNAREKNTPIDVEENGAVKVFHFGATPRKSYKLPFKVGTKEKILLTADFTFALQFDDTSTTNVVVQPVELQVLVSVAKKDKEGNAYLVVSFKKARVPKDSAIDDETRAELKPVLKALTKGKCAFIVSPQAYLRKARCSYPKVEEQLLHRIHPAAFLFAQGLFVPTPSSTIGPGARWTVTPSTMLFFDEATFNANCSYSLAEGDVITASCAYTPRHTPLAAAPLTAAHSEKNTFRAVVTGYQNDVGITVRYAENKLTPVRYEITVVESVSRVLHDVKKSSATKIVTNLTVRANAIAVENKSKKKTSRNAKR